MGSSMLEHGTRKLRNRTKQARSIHDKLVVFGHDIYAYTFTLILEYNTYIYLVKIGKFWAGHSLP